MLTQEGKSQSSCAYPESPLGVAAGVMLCASCSKSRLVGTITRGPQASTVSDPSSFTATLARATQGSVEAGGQVVAASRHSASRNRPDLRCSETSGSALVET